MTRGYREFVTFLHPFREEVSRARRCTIERTPALRYGSGRSSLEKPNRWLFVAFGDRSSPHGVDLALHRGDLILELL